MNKKDKLLKLLKEVNNTRTKLSTELGREDVANKIMGIFYQTYTISDESGIVQKGCFK